MPGHTDHYIISNKQHCTYHQRVLYVCIGWIFIYIAFNILHTTYNVMYAAIGIPIRIYSLPAIQYRLALHHSSSFNTEIENQAIVRTV